jgi:hypothetical protein
MLPGPPMKTFRPLLVLLLGLTPVLRAAEATGVYELRTYTTEPGKLDTLLARFRDHTVKLFEKHGITNVAYWVPMDEKDGAGGKLVYLLAHKSRDAATAAWKEFSADPDWKAVVKASEASGKIVTKVESVFIAATDFSPALKVTAEKTPRVFELRTYTTPDEARLAALDARFGGGETALFTKEGMTGVMFTHPLDADKGAGHTLIYLLAHANRDAAAASWKKFRDDPAWVKMKADSEKAAGGSLTTKTESMFLAPVDFSPLK